MTRIPKEVDDLLKHMFPRKIQRVLWWEKRHPYLGCPPKEAKLPRVIGMLKQVQKGVYL